MSHSLNGSHFLLTREQKLLRTSFQDISSNDFIHVFFPLKKKKNITVFLWFWWIPTYQGWQWGGAGPKDEIFAPAQHGFFLPHPRPLRPRKAPPYTIKLYFLLIFPTTITIFSNKITCFNNKNILEIINKFILSNQTNFQQKLNNII